MLNALRYLLLIINVLVVIDDILLLFLAKHTSSSNMTAKSDMTDFPQLDLFIANDFKQPH